jgi:hypothetical protein
MSKVTIYQFAAYDISTDQMQRSRRWGTRSAIERIGGEVLEETATEVDIGVVSSEIQGLSERGFDPLHRTGFQQVVNR